MFQNLSSIEKAIVLTIAYCDQFSFPLTEQEIWRRFIGANGTETVGTLIPSQRSFSIALHSLLASGLIEQKNSYFFLKNRQRIVKIREKRSDIAKKKENEVVNFLAFAKKIPWIQAVFVTGSLAMRNSEFFDDIDFMLVVSPKRLWLCRVLVALYAFFKGKKRSWNGREDWSLFEKSHSAASLQDSVKKFVLLVDVDQATPASQNKFFPSNLASFRKKGTFQTGSNNWCLNLWLDTKHLQVPAEKRGVYRAYEVIQASCVMDRGGVKNLFEKKNNWIGAYLPNWKWDVFDKKSPKPTWSLSRQFSTVISWVSSPFWNVADLLFYRLQLWYMSSHRTSEQVARAYAFFHPRDTEAIVQQGLEQSIQTTIKHMTDIFLPAVTQKKIERAHAQNQKIVLVTGVFDVLHQEHITFLNKAKAIGDLLVVGVESDKRVREIKGEGRPLNAQEKRVKNISALEISDGVFILPEQFSRPEDHEALIQKIRPSFLAVSSHTAHLEEKKRLLEKYGGKVKVVHKHNPKISTTQLLQKKKETT